MPRHLLQRASLLATLLFTTACTQPAAQVDMRGSSDFSRNNSGGNSYKVASSNGASSGYVSRNAAPVSYGKTAYKPAPVYTNTAPPASVNMSTSQSAGVQSIGVNDLAPPPKTAAAPAAKPQSAAAQPTPVNPWTGKPRTLDAAGKEESFNIRPQGKPAGKEQLVSEIRPAQEKEESVARLDQVIGKEGDTKPVVLTKAAKAESANGFMWPVGSRKVVSGFGPKGGGKANDGINIASAEGEPVWAASDGEVVYVGNELQGYGNMVLIKHPGGKTTTYAHLNRYTVDKYDRVKQGDIIGYVGSSGNVKSPQLHFAVRDGKDFVDPRKVLNRNVAGL